MMSKNLLTSRIVIPAIVLIALVACGDGSSDRISTTTATADSAATSDQAPVTEPATPSSSSTSATTHELLDEVELELQTWGISQDSIECVTDGLVKGGYVEGLDDLSYLDLLFVDEADPLSEFPPEMAHFMEGFFRYLADPQDGCLRPAELTTVFENLSIQAEDLGYSSYGDDATLDQLYDGCAAGSLADCDMLFLAADFGSEYEEMATTCGGVVETIDPTSTCMSALQNFSETEALASQCEGGFYLACDAYFVVTVVGSEEEAVAASCGGIRDPNLTTPCWLAYGFGSR